MKRNMITFILAGTMALSMCSCGDREPENFDNIGNPATEMIQTSETLKEQEEIQTEATQSKDDAFSFANLENCLIRNFYLPSL